MKRTKPNGAGAWLYVLLCCLILGLPKKTTAHGIPFTDSSYWTILAHFFVPSEVKTIPINGKEVHPNGTDTPSEAIEAGTTIFFVDSDGDGVDDEVDLDDDNDGVLDEDEADRNCTLNNYPINNVEQGTRSAFFENTGNVSLKASLSSTKTVSFIQESGTFLSANQRDYGDTYTLVHTIEKTNSPGLVNAIFLPRAPSFTLYTNFTSFTIEFDETLFTATIEDAIPERLAGSSPMIQEGSQLQSNQLYLVPNVGTVTVNNPFAVRFSPKREMVEGEISQISWTQEFDGATMAVEQSAMAFSGCDNFGDFDTDGDGIVNRLDLDSDGDGCSDAYESGATSDSSTDFQFPDTAVGTNGLHDGLETSPDSGEINYGSSYVYSALESAIAPCNVEICGDGIDNDADGYIDGFDSDCVSIPDCVVTAGDNSNFSIVKSYSTPRINANSVTPVVGDIDADGMPEIIVASANPNAAGYRIYKGDGSDFNDSTLDIQLPLEVSVNFPVTSPAIADIDKDGTAEIIALGSDQHLYVFDHTGGTSSSYMLKTTEAVGYNTGSPRVHDINEDGIPEIIVGNAVYTFNASYTSLDQIVQGTITEPDGSVIENNLEWDKDMAVVDILPEYPGKEMVAGGTIYTIDFANGTRTAVKQLNDIDASWPLNTDGAVAIADMDLDGDLDVVITSVFNTYSIIWDPVEDQVIKKVDTGTGRHGMPLIADVYDDIGEGGQSINLPETIFMAGGTIYCINAQFSGPVWTLATSDASSTTSISSYDFNGDGIVELVYRDQSELRIFNGNSATPTVLASFTAGSGTWAEGPVIADVDNDGHAEIVLVSDVVPTVTAVGEGHLDIFDSGEEGSWVDAPNYWNQRGYRYSNINPDLTVPIKEQTSQLAIPEGSGIYPLNIYNTQVNDGSLFTDSGEIAAPDITTANSGFVDDGNGDYHCPDLTLNLQFHNQGDAVMPSGFYVSLFDGDPTQAGTSLVRTLLFPEPIAPGTTASVDFQLVIPPDLYPFTTLYYAINTKKNVILPLDSDDYNVNPEECDYTNNVFQLAMPPCEDGDSDGIADFVDIDDDNDGVLDTTETTDDCRYVGGYDINSLSFSGSTDVDVKTTAESITTRKAMTNAVWGSVYTDEVFDLPLHLEFTASLETVHAMIGLIPETGTHTPDNWNDAGYKVHFTNSGSDFVIRYNGSTPIYSGTYADGDVFALNIDADGNISTYQNNLLIHSQTVPVEAYQMVLSDYTTMSRTYGDIIFDTWDNLYYLCEDKDTDNDGTPDRLDLDSDGDGCSDAYESGATSDSSTDYQFPDTAVGVNGLHDGVETSPDSGEINYGSTYALFALDNDPDSCSDSDGDGIDNLTDLDDDNDGILDTLEDSYNCTYLGGEDLSAFTFNNDAAINANFTEDDLSVNRTGGTTWASTYSLQTVSVPLHFEFTVDAVNSRTMVGLIEQTATRTPGSWNDQSHKFYFLSNVNYNIRDFGSGALNADTYVAGDVFAIDIDASGNLSMKRNGVEVYSDSVTGTNFRLVFSAVDATQKTLSDMVYGNTDEMVSHCEDRDTDGDGIVDRLDLDSDNDGCADANEAYQSNNADSNGDGTYGDVVGPAETHPDGTVIAASYPGTHTNVTVATSLNISQPVVDQTVSLYENTTFTVSASAINTTAYTGTPPSTTPDYTIPPATETSTDPEYQWQVDDGSGFVDITDGGIYSGATTNTLTLTKVKATEDSNQYRVLVTHPDNVCAIEESTATLTVEMPVPFACDGSAYLVSSPNATTPSTVYIVDATNPNNVLATITPSIADRYNAIGYNFEDNLIYGMAQGDTPSFTHGDLFFIDGNGDVTPLGVPTAVAGQAPGLAVWTANASVNGNGGRLAVATGVVGNNSQFYSFVHTDNTARYLAIVDLSTMKYTTQRLSLDMASQSDLAFSPYNGMLYGIQGGRIIQTNPNNGQQTIITVAGGSATLPGASGGAWNDIQGRVYFYNNVASTTNRLYRYDPATNMVTALVGVEAYPTFDATACFPTRLEKQVSIPSGGFVPGDVVEYEFSIYNNQVLPMTYDFEDVLASPDLSWVAGSLDPSAPGGGMVNISGQTLNINEITVQPSAATGGPLTFRVSVKIADNAAYGGCYDNQASITTGGTTVVSDNPETEEHNDPTLFCLNPCTLAAPLSGGNIQECASDPIQKITATATVPPGVQLIWYDAPVNGNEVADPSLETIGSVTYYAAADDGTCISQNRTPVTLNMRPAPILDAIEDQMSCVSYELPEIMGTDLSGNEAYYTAPNGGGTQYLPGDVINNIGTATLYVYDEMAAVDNCEGNISTISNTGYVIDNLFGDGGTHHQYPEAIDPNFWQGAADQQLLYDAPGVPVGPQIYLGGVGDVSIGNTDDCFGDEINVQAQVTVTNQGPGNGAGYPGRLAIINTSTNQVLYEIHLTTNFPANSTMTPTVSGVVPTTDVLAGNIAILIVVETYQGSSKNWLLSDFSAGYQFMPESMQACSDEQSFALTINELPNLVITDPDPVCLPGTVDLTDAAVTTGSAPSLVFRYFTDAEGTTEMANPEAVSTTGTYYIQGEDPATGCSNLMPVEAVLIDAPEVIVGQPFCINGQGSIEVTDPLGADFEYSINGTDYQTDPVFVSVAPGTYSVTTRNMVTNCVSLATEAIVNEDPEAPTPVVTQPDCDVATGTIFVPEYTDATYSIDGGTTFGTENVFDNLLAGDYTVVIRDGFACDSDPVVITIDAAPEVPTAPTSGGDQTVCADNPVQTLTATATVDTGETLVWYDAPTSGNIVANPILDAIGTVTYYAEATNASCPSAVRTPIVLTIEPAPHIDPLIDQVSCGEFVLPVISGVGLSGNEAYYNQQDGLGARYEAGEIISTVGSTTLYMYDMVGGCSDEQAFTLNIQDEVTPGTIGQDQTICAGDTPLEITSETPGTGSGNLSYRWEQSTTDALSGFTVIVGAVTASYAPPALTQTTYYRRTVISNQYGMDCESSPTATITITVQDVVTAGAIDSDQTICNGETPTILTSELDGEGSGNITYRWEESTDGVVFATLAGETGTNYGPGALTQTTYYRRITLSEENGVSCESAPTNIITITVQDTVTEGAIGSDQTICNGDTPATLTSTLDGTGSGNLTYRWEESTDGVTFVPIAGETSADFSPSALTQTTYYRRITLSEENGVSCESAPTVAITITVQDETTAGNIGPDQTICNGDTPLAIISTEDGSGSGNITYRWEESTDGMAFTPIAGEITATYTPGALALTTYYRRITLSEENGVFCESGPTNTVTITVQDAVSAGSIGSDQTICNGDVPSMLTSTVDGTGSGSITYRWEESADGVSFVPIIGETTANYSPNALTQTTYFRRITISGVNGIFCESAPTTMITITVQDAVTEGTIGSDQTICNGETPATLTSALVGTGSGTISYRWEESTDGVSFVPIAGETASGYSPGTLVQTTYFRRITLSDENGVSCESIPSNMITITVQDAVDEGTIGSDQTICNGETPPTITSTMDGSGSGSITYRWEESIDGVNFVPITGETLADYSPGALTQTTYFRRITLSEENGVSCESAPTNPVSITVQDTVTEGTIGSDQTICNGDVPSTLTSTLDGTGSGSITYRWEESTDGVTFVPIAGETGASYSPGALTQTTYFRRITLSEENGIACESIPTNMVSITVQDTVVEGSIGSDQTICNGETPSALTSALDGSGSGNITYRWEESTDGVTFVPIAGETGTVYSPGALIQTTYFRRITLSEENGVSCESTPTAIVTITVQDVTAAGNIGSDQTICNGETPTTITSTLDGSGSGTITYRWEESTDGVAFASIAGATLTNYSPGALAETTYFRRVTISEENGMSCESAPTNMITITVQDGVSAGSIGSDQTICNGDTPSALNSILDGTGSGSITYRWEESTNGISFVPIAGETSADYSPGALAQTTYFRRITLSDENGISCESSPTTMVTITVQDAVSTGSIGSDQTICNGETPSTLTSTLDGTGSGNITYRWEESTDGVAFVSIAGETGADYSPGALTQTTHYRRVTLSEESGVSCASGFTNTLTITVQDGVGAGTIGSDQTICNGGTPSPLTSTLDGTGSGNVTYRWEESADGVAFVPITGETGTSYSPGVLAQTTYFRRVTLSEENGVSCESVPTATVMITVQDVVTGGSIGSDQTICNGETPLAIVSTANGTGSGTVSYRWEESTDETNFTPIPGAVANSYGLGALTQTTHYRRITLSEDNGVICESAPSNTVTITVTPIPEGYDDTLTGLDCSGSFSYNLQGNVNDTANGGNGIPADFIWTPLPNPDVSGASAGSGPSIDQSLINLTTAVQTVVYRITARSMTDGSCSSEFELSVNVPVCSSLDFEKVSDVSSVDGAGDLINYTIALTNTGNASHSGVVVDDPLLGGTLSNLSGDNGNNILEAGESWIYTGSYTVSQADLENNGNPVTGSGFIHNVATLNTDQLPSSQTAENDVAIEIDPGITLVKTAEYRGDPAQAQQGDVITYTFTVTNTGNVNIGNLTVNDPLLGGNIGNPTNGDTNGNGLLELTETWIYEVDYAISQEDVDRGSVENQAVANGTTAEGDTVSDVSGTSETNDDPTWIPLPPYAVISLVKTASFNDLNGDGYAQVGETITYAFTVANVGERTLTNISLTDPKVSVAGGPIASLSPGESDDSTFTAEYTITQADIDLGTVSNTATVTGMDPGGYVVADQSGTDTWNDAPTQIVLPLEASMELVKTSVFNDENADGFAQEGETISYTFTVTNTGNIALTGIQVDDPMLEPSILEVTPSELLPGETATATASYTITQRDWEEGMVTNTARVSGQTADGVEVSDVSGTAGDNDDPTVTPLQVGIENIFIPNVITPNGDGDNDVFEITGLPSSAQLYLIISNRWGNEVYKNSSYKNDFNGEGLNEGTYFYQISISDPSGSEQSYQGWLFIKR